MPIKVREVAETFLVAFSGLLVALALAWGLLALVNFSYPIWHDHGGINEAINRYGGENRFRAAFDQTTPEQRYELFAGINLAIHRGGEGLAELTYQVPGHPAQQLLREPEIVHLQDVANLVTAGKYAAATAFVLWLAAWVYFASTARSIPSLKRQIIYTLSFVGLVGLVVLVLGPVQVFYALHELIFPPGHEWFFYYQDSLMSTMMYAPVLFGYIALEWLVLALVLFVVLQMLAARLVQRWKETHDRLH